MSARATRRRTDLVSRAFCSVLGLGGLRAGRWLLQLGGAKSAGLVQRLGISQAHAVAVLDGHPSAVTMRILKPLCGMAGIDLVQALQAVEQQQGGADR